MNGAEKQRHGITELSGARATQRTNGRGKAWQSSERNGYGMKRTARAGRRKESQRTVWQGQRAVVQGQSTQCITLRGDGKARLGEALSSNGGVLRGSVEFSIAKARQRTGQQRH